MELQDREYDASRAVQQKLAVAVSSSAGPARDTEELRKRADELVRDGRCEEAIKVYQELDRRSQYVSPRERASYVHCLTATGRQEQAAQALDELKADKSVTNAQVQQVQDEVEAARTRLEHRRAEGKKAKKSAPAVRADQPGVAAEPPPAASAPARKAPAY
jgi:hypothetical protein